MTRQDLGRARQLVRLRELALETAMRELTEATAMAATAAEAAARALADRDAGLKVYAAARSALVDDPADAPSGLARIAFAEDKAARLEQILISARDESTAADEAVIEARQAARRAQARRDAMADRADRLRRTLAVSLEERVAIEAEEGAAAMRRAA